MGNCKGVMAVSVTTEYKKNHVSVARIRCKLWSCTYCAKENRRQWRATLFKRLPEITKLWSWHTFTTGSHDEMTIEQSVNVIRNGWEKLIKRLKREYGSFSYVRTIELHKSGHPHIHALFSVHVDCEFVQSRKGKQRHNGKKGYWYSPTIKTHLEECDFGYIGSSENLLIDEETGLYKALGYATKYMTKREKTDEKINLRFIQTSRDIKLKNLEKSDLSWSLKSGIYEDEVLEVRHFDIDTQKRITADDFEESFIYPIELKWTIADFLGD